MIFVVLGMHKSGTTLVARTLHESGIVMGQEFPRNADYGTSKFEAKWAQSINDTILGANRDLLSLNVTSSLLADNNMTDAVRRRMAEGVADMTARYNNWGFKDPRTALTYRFWRDVLPPHRLIVVYRDPIEVWRRYSRVNRRGLSRKAFRVWCDYNGKILEALPSIPSDNVLILEFEHLLSGNDEVRKLRQFVGKDLVDIRDPLQSKYRVSDKQRLSLGYKALNLIAGREVRSIYDRLVCLGGQ